MLYIVSYVAFFFFSFFYLFYLLIGWFLGHFFCLVLFSLPFIAVSSVFILAIELSNFSWLLFIVSSSLLE